VSDLSSIGAGKSHVKALWSSASFPGQLSYGVTAGASAYIPTRSSLSGVVPCRGGSVIWAVSERCLRLKWGPGSRSRWSVVPGGTCPPVLPGTMQGGWDAGGRARSGLAIPRSCSSPAPCPSLGEKTPQFGQRGRAVIPCSQGPVSCRDVGSRSAGSGFDPGPCGTRLCRAVAGAPGTTCSPRRLRTRPLLALRTHSLPLGLETF